MNELLLKNGILWSAHLNGKFEEAIFIKDGFIKAIGKTKDIENLKTNNTKVIDLEGKFVSPGFIDSHLHLVDSGLQLISLNMRNTKSKDEFLSRIEKYIIDNKNIEWITGGGWDHELMGGEMPDKSWIDGFTADIPVFLMRMDGHIGIANSKALKLAGIDENTKAPPGGAILKNKDGSLKGLLKDNAIDLMNRVMPTADFNKRLDALNAATDYLFENGVTSAHTMSLFATSDIEFLQKAKDDLRIRVFCTHPIVRYKELAAIMEEQGRGDEWLRIGASKAFADGSLGAHTAAFFDDYNDEPGNNGLLVMEEDEILEYSLKADKLNQQLMIHAIGDRAINSLLNIAEKLNKQNGKRDRRFRIEHVQHMQLSDAKRFAELDVIPSMQPYHLMDEGWAIKALGEERLKGSYAFKSLIDAGAKTAFGSDWFVAPPDVIMGIYAAVNRITFDGNYPNGWINQQKISIEDTLKSYTINAAYSVFEENMKGTLEPGKLADLVILENNPFEMDEKKLDENKIFMTIVNGNIVFYK